MVTGLLRKKQERHHGGPDKLIDVDNHSALDVGHLKEGTRSFVVRGPKLEEGCPEVSIREGPEELTLRTEEVGSKKKRASMSIKMRRTGVHPQ